MDKASLKVLVDLIFSGAILAAKGRPAVSIFLNLAKSWIDGQLDPIAAHIATQ